MHELTLSDTNRATVAAAFNSVKRVDISIDCVIEDSMGKAFVDNVDKPSAFKIAVGPFVYFAGDAGSAGGREMIEALDNHCLIMPSADGWPDAIRAKFGERLQSFPRYTYSSESLLPGRMDEIIAGSRFAKEVRPIDLEMATQAWSDREDFVEIDAFASPEDFVTRGAGYLIEARGRTIGAAFSSLRNSCAMELSLHVVPRHRRRGIATVLCAFIIKHCLENDLDPHWDAANKESCALAEKLGYTFVGEYQAYFLSNQR